MKQENPDAKLRERMQAWKVTTPLPVRFQANVWDRIEQAEAQTFGVIGRLLVQRLMSMTLRPAFAAGYVTALMVVGLGAGWWAASAKTEQWETVAAGKYIQMVDPLQRND